MGIMEDIRGKISEAKSKMEQERYEKLKKKAEREEERAEKTRRDNIQLERIRSAQREVLKHESLKADIRKKEQLIGERRAAPIKAIVGAFTGGVSKNQRAIKHVKRQADYISNAFGAPSVSAKGKKTKVRDLGDVL